jgi:hypothetical protein
LELCWWRKKQAWIDKGLKAKGSMKARGTYDFIYMTGEKIVALDRGAYPEKLGKCRGFLNRFAIGSLGIQAGSYSVDRLG